MFDVLRRANIDRQAEWCPDQQPDLSFRGNELAGEVGEACNVIKKLERERHGWIGSRSTPAKLAEELADVVICADLTAMSLGIDLGQAVIEKFNATSVERGLSTKLPSKVVDYQNPCAKIFTHKWLDPQCVENGCQSIAHSFQARVRPWLLECFGEMIAGDREERNHRFLEEALELVQSLGCSREESHQLVDYVYDRSIGDPNQEVGGVMVTLAALCLANGFDMHTAGEVELSRILVPETIAKIRAKQAAKPKHSPLPA